MQYSKIACPLSESGLGCVKTLEVFSEVEYLPLRPAFELVRLLNATLVPG